MALNLNKGGKLGKYFYIRDNVEYGPFEISDLLESIDKDTLVYFKGMNWTKASEVKELKKYFTTEQRVVEKIIERTHVEPAAESRSYFLPILILLTVLAVSFTFFVYQKMENTNFEFEQDKLEQKRISDSIAFVNAKLKAQMQQDSINAIYNSKIDSLKSLEDEVSFLQNQEILVEKIENYYSAISNNSFDAYNYFSDTVDHFINFQNTTPEEINSMFNSNRDYSDENVLLDKSSFIFIRQINNIYYFNYTINYRCFRKKRNKTQTCDVDIEIGFDENSKIKSYRELNIRNLIFE